jgi:hypothetical protein
MKDTSYTPPHIPPAHIPAIANKTLSLRLTTEVRNFLEKESEKHDTSLTCVALSAFDLLHAATRQKEQNGDWLYW